MDCSLSLLPRSCAEAGLGEGEIASVVLDVDGLGPLHPFTAECVWGASARSLWACTLDWWMPF